VIRALAPDEIFARRRPRAVLAVYLWELAWALVVIAPVASWARRAWSAHPDGDALVFAPGGRYLMAWLDLFGEHSIFPIVLRTSLVLLVIGAVLAQAPLAALLASLATGHGEDGAPPRLGEAIRASGGSILALEGVLALVALLEIVVFAVGVFAAGGVSRAGAARWGDASGFWIAAGVFAAFALVASVAGVFADLARAAIVRDVAIADAPASPLTLVGRGLRRALRVGRRGLARAYAEWASRAAIGLALLAFGALASEGLGGRGGLALVGLAAAHQVVVLARVALRASWLARALRLVGA
jgi:hypothetical protein